MFDTFAGLLDGCAALRPHRPLVVHTDGTTLSIADVAELSAAAASWLFDAGVRPGMTVAWQFPSRIESVIVMFALARMPVTQAPMIHLYRSRELAAAAEAARADVLLVDGPTAADTPPTLATIDVPADFTTRLRRSTTPPFRHDPALSASETGWIYFTSGTTGKPKAVRHTDATLLSAARGYLAHLGLGSHPHEMGTITYPIGHVGGSVYVATALLGDFPLLLVPKVTEELPRLLARHAVTVTNGTTAYYQMLLDAQLAAPTTSPLIPSLRMLAGGGAPCPPEVHEQVRQHLRVPVFHGYGMTEAPMTCVSEYGDTEDQLTNSAGRPTPGTQVRIGENGEIQLHGTGVSPGYVDHHAWAAATTPEGWFRTGDIGRLRPDGRIVVIGRLKNVIIRKGENIAPDEIEAELLAHPLIEAVSVVGLPDKASGEVICAVVRRPRHGQREVTLGELCAFLDAQGLMKQKWPERLGYVDDFPLTGLGKIDKAELIRHLSRPD
ncbi:class I adenylate-forming enzyme family protein [Nocardia gamkensis]|uniref:class I adenylate-forming enzyme family protein n=1 Tax=Nocardia gamkensis TaxID=352869 RepID=UPI0036E0352D